MLTVTCTLALLLVASGCGTERQPRVNNDRPAVPVVLSVFLGDNGVEVSPKVVGAGALDVIITNRSSKARRVTLETTDQPGGEPGSVALRTTPISPREVTTVQASVDPGSYTLRSGKGESARLQVGPPRPSSQSELLTP